METASDSVLSRYLDPEVLRRLRGHRFEPRGLVDGTLAGAHRSSHHGFAVEFAGHREYVPGDDPRHIDWRVYYTRGKYFVKQYEMETNLVCHLVLDASASMRYGEGEEQKLLHAARAAVTLGHAVVSQSDRVSLATFDDEITGIVPPGSSMAQVVRITEHLDRTGARRKTRMAECLGELAGRMGRREIVIVLSDLFTDLGALEPVLARLRYDEHEVVLLHVLHRDEIAFGLDGVVRFVGLEDGREFIVETGDFRDGYLEAFAAFEARVEEICRRHRIERVLLDTSRELGASFLDYFDRRRRLRHRR